MTEIRVGYEPDFAPLTAAEDEVATGLVIKLLDRVFAEIGASPTYIPVDLKEHEAALESGRVDAVAFKAIVPGRDAFRVSLPFLETGAAFFGKSRLDGMPWSIATPEAGPLYRQLKAQLPDSDIVATDSYDATLQLAADGTVAAAALNFHVGCHLAERDYAGVFVLPEKPYQPLPVALAVGADFPDETLAAFNEALENVLAAEKSDG